MQEVRVLFVSLNIIEQYSRYEHIRFIQAINLRVVDHNERVFCIHRR